MDTPTTKYPDLQKLFKHSAEYLTAENARELLAPFICPRCDSEETLGVFYEPNNGGTGIVCQCCGLKHPLRGVMCLPRDKHSKPKRSNDIAARDQGARKLLLGLRRRLRRITAAADWSPRPPHPTLRQVRRGVPKNSNVHAVPRTHQRCATSPPSS
jgi:hypothetical protein